jgi:hypothetical protein
MESEARSRRGVALERIAATTSGNGCNRIDNIAQRVEQQPICRRTLLLVAACQPCAEYGTDHERERGRDQRHGAHGTERSRRRRRFGVRLGS